MAKDPSIRYHDQSRGMLRGLLIRENVGRDLNVIQTELGQFDLSRIHAFLDDVITFNFIVSRKYEF